GLLRDRAYQRVGRAAYQPAGEQQVDARGVLQRLGDEDRVGDDGQALAGDEPLGEGERRGAGAEGDHVAVLDHVGGQGGDRILLRGRQHALLEERRLATDDVRRRRTAVRTTYQALLREVTQVTTCGHLGRADERCGLPHGDQALLLDRF